MAAQSRMQLAFLQHADEIRRGMLAIWRNAEAPLHVRLQAGREILDRGLGKAQQSVALTAELGLNQNLDTASPRPKSSRPSWLPLGDPCLRCRPVPPSARHRHDVAGWQGYVPDAWRLC
jgi:hypothetical protein